MSFAVLCDFDGTIVDIDTAAFVLDRFGEKNWRKIDDQLERGEISFEESLVKEFAMLKVPEKVMLDALEPATHFRPNFGVMLEYCKEHNFPLIIASAGLEFSVKHFLERNGWLESLQVHGPKARSTRDGVKLTFPRLLDRESENFKDDLARYQKRQGRKVAYIGDGIGDFPAAKIADLAFAVKGSRLAKLCTARRVHCVEITDFKEVVNSIKGRISHENPIGTRKDPSPVNLD